MNAGYGAQEGIWKGLLKCHKRRCIGLLFPPHVHSFSYPHDLCLGVKNPVIAQGDHFLGIKGQMTLFLLLLFSTFTPHSVDNVVF